MGEIADIKPLKQEVKELKELVDSKRALGDSLENALMEHIYKILDNLNKRNKKNEIEDEYVLALYAGPKCPIEERLTVVALPKSKHLPSGGPGNELGQCENCKIWVASISKHATCPICKKDVGLS